MEKIILALVIFLTVAIFSFAEDNKSAPKKENTPAIDVNIPTPAVSGKVDVTPLPAINQVKPDSPPGQEGRRVIRVGNERINLNKAISEVKIIKKGDPLDQYKTGEEDKIIQPPPNPNAPLPLPAAGSKDKPK